MTSPRQSGQRFLPLRQEGLIATLYAEAITQGDIVFGQDGLTIYAAPWRYAFMTKLDRLSKPFPRRYDIDDAIDYLEKHILKTGNQPITTADIEKWAVEFALENPLKSVINDVQSRYTEKHGDRVGIVCMIKEMEMWIYRNNVQFSKLLVNVLFVFQDTAIGIRNINALSQ